MGLDGDREDVIMLDSTAGRKKPAVASSRTGRVSLTSTSQNIVDIHQMLFNRPPYQPLTKKIAGTMVGRCWLALSLTHIRSSWINGSCAAFSHYPQRLTETFIIGSISRRCSLIGIHVQVACGTVAIDGTSEGRSQSSLLQLVWGWVASRN